MENLFQRVFFVIHSHSFLPSFLHSLSHSFLFSLNKHPSIQSNYPLILLLRVLRRYLLFRVVPQLKQLSLIQRRSERRDKARRHDIQQCWLHITLASNAHLRMLKRDHHHHCDQQRQRIENDACVEVRLAPIRALRRVFSLFASVVRVERQQKGDEEAGNHHIAQTEHTEALARVFQRSRQNLREDEFDGTFHPGCHFHHDLCTEDPENVV